VARLVAVAAAGAEHPHILQAVDQGKVMGIVPPLALDATQLADKFQYHAALVTLA
jgi:hypothetical protein